MLNVVVFQICSKLSKFFFKSGHFKKTVVLAILISFKIVVVFNSTSADSVLMSADVVLKTTTTLKEMRIAQLSSLKERTLPKI